jgi:hypothetical protein
LKKKHLVVFGFNFFFNSSLWNFARFPQTQTTYRETHEIFTDTNHANVGLIVFTVVVPYAQLTHYFWGLVMSLLQYRRDKQTHYILYLVPGAIITVIDIGLMVGIVYHITDKCGRGKDADLQRHNVKKKDLLKRRLKTVVLLFFLFGISTVFEMFNDIREHVAAVEYISKIINPVQEFVLFVFFIVLDGRTRSLCVSRFYKK